MSVTAAPTPRPRADLHGDAFVREFASVLQARGAVDDLALGRALRAQRQSGERFDIVLTRLGLIAEAQLLPLLAEHLGMAHVTSEGFPAQPLYADRLNAAFLRTNQLLPLEDGAEGLKVAIADPGARDALDALGYLLERPITPLLAAPADIERAIARLYDAQGQQPATAGDDAAAGGGMEDADVRQLADLGSEAPVIRLVNDLIDSAAGLSASDIHIEPREDCLAIRFRIDGHLQMHQQLAPALRPAVTSRIKIMARLNIAEQRLPQDGRIKTTVRGRDLDLRISTMPTLRGESVVMRLLDTSNLALEFSALGFADKDRARLDAALAEPNGIVLVTGPTGSGKTTTLYAALMALNRPTAKIFTVEDPVEYQIDGINQIQVQPKISLNFATALRSILRQDPDIILVGEMRDLETAEVAIQSSLTGHLVLSTVHTNSAAATITRLLDMGVEPYLIASTLKAIVAQRLVRKLCAGCCLPLADTSPERTMLQQLRAQAGSALDDVPDAARSPGGCARCRETGYAGRTTVSEVMPVSDAIKRAILARASEAEIEAIARREGMTTMFEDGVAKAAGGITTLQEVVASVRATAPDFAP